MSCRLMLQVPSSLLHDLEAHEQLNWCHQPQLPLTQLYSPAVFLLEMFALGNSPSPCKVIVEKDLSE